MTMLRGRTTAATPAQTAIGFTLQTKGLLGMAGRLCTVTTRFGATPRPMVARLERMVELTAAAKALPTLPITAAVLERNPGAAESLLRAGVEFAVHGLYHNDHARESASSQEVDIRRAVAVFRRCGIEPVGFRAPYLRANKGTSTAVRAAGLSYQSDDSVVFDIAAFGPYDPTGDAYLRALVMYQALDASTVTCRPALVDDLVRIPVCLPDDEMLADRLHLTDEQCAGIWCSLLDMTHKRGDLFTMQIHPERFGKAAQPLSCVLDRAAALPGGTWFAQLREIADWWRARSRCEFALTSESDGRLTIAVHGDPRARLRVSGGASPALAEGVHRSMTLPADPFPGVGLRSDAPMALRTFLREEGYLTRVATVGQRCAVELDNAIDVHNEVALRALIDAAPTPVVAINRWPEGLRSALAVTGDIDAFTVHDFIRRVTGDRYRRRRDGASS